MNKIYNIKKIKNFVLRKFEIWPFLFFSWPTLEFFYGLAILISISTFQVLGKIPSIFVEKTDGCQMYLSRQSLDVEIVSAKSSEMNVLIPSADGSDFVSTGEPRYSRFWHSRY